MVCAGDLTLTDNLLFIAGESYYGESGNNQKNIYDGLCNKLDNNFATEYHHVYNPESGFFLRSGKYKCSYETLNGYYLTGINTDKVCEVKDTLTFYMFPKIIDNIHGTIDLFNDVFTDSSYFADLRFGIENKDYTIINGNAHPADVSGAYLSLKQITPLNESIYSYFPQSTDYIDSLMPETFFEKSIFNETHTYSHGILGCNEHFGYNNYRLLDSMFNKYVSAYDSIIEYKLQFGKSGRRQFIEELNEKIGSATSYNYE